MSILHHWQKQKEALHSALTNSMSPSDVVIQVRHALLQTEQNALAEMDDNVLRQQAGILLSSLKGSLGFLETHTAGQTWIAMKTKPAPSSSFFWRLALAFLSAAAILCGFCDEWFAMVLSICGIAVGTYALMTDRKNLSGAAQQDKLKVTISVDIDRMLALLDAQLRAVDRFLDDFAYLNAQAQGAARQTDPDVLSRAVDLMEALYDCTEDEREPIEYAARQLLMRLGMETVEYTEENSRLFNALPSKSVTRTISPAIISADEKKLLRRGTAAVRIGAA